MTDGLTITRTFPVTPESVFAAWTMPEVFSVWFGTDAVDVPLDTLSMDVRPGGAWSAVMHLPDGHQIHWEGSFVEIDPPNRLVLTMTDAPGTDPGAPLTVDLVAVEGGTEMIFTQMNSGFTDEQYAQLAEGYRGFFDTMERVLTAEG